MQWVFTRGVCVSKSEWSNLSPSGWMTKLGPHPKAFNLLTFQPSPKKKFYAKKISGKAILIFFRAKLASQPACWAFFDSSNIYTLRMYIIYIKKKISLTYFCFFQSSKSCIDIFLISYKLLDCKFFFAQTSC